MSNYIATKHNPMAAAALAQAITLSRKGHSGTQKDQRSGRIDKRRVARVGTGDLRVFQRPGAPAPDKVRVTILLDASGSMNAPATRVRDRVDENGYPRYTSRLQVAAQVGRDLAAATDLLPWVTADVAAFTTGYDGTVLYDIWRTGEDPSTLDMLDKVRLGGTEEGYAIAFATDEMVERLRGREQGLIIIVSDGAPSEPAHVKSVVEAAAKLHIPVVSVALVESAHQPAMYGRDNVVKYDGNARVLARRMAQVIGRVL